MKRSLLCTLLPLLFCSSLAHAAPFHEGKTMAHPGITASQDSGADVTFIKEKGGVNGYSCECSSSGSKTMLLDQLGSAVIGSVFYASPDRDCERNVQTMLLRQNDKNTLRAYRFDRKTAVQQIIQQISRPG